MDEVYVSTVKYVCRVYVVDVDKDTITFHCGEVPVHGHILKYLVVPIDSLFRDDSIGSSYFASDGGHGSSYPIPSIYILEDIDDTDLAIFIVRQCRKKYTEWLVDN